MREEKAKDNIHYFFIQAGFRGTDKSKLTEVFTQRSLAHLRAMFQEYERVNTNKWSLLLFLLLFEVVMMIMIMVMMMILVALRMNLPLPD